MKLSTSLVGLLGLCAGVSAVPQNVKRSDDGAQFDVGQPISADGKGGPILGEHIRTGALSRPFVAD